MCYQSLAPSTDESILPCRVLESILASPFAGAASFLGFTPGRFGPVSSLYSSLAFFASSLIESGHSSLISLLASSLSSSLPELEQPLHETLLQWPPRSLGVVNRHVVLTHVGQMV